MTILVTQSWNETYASINLGWLISINDSHSTLTIYYIYYTYTSFIDSLSLSGNGEKNMEWLHH